MLCIISPAVVFSFYLSIFRSYQLFAIQSIISCSAGTHQIWREQTFRPSLIHRFRDGILCLFFPSSSSGVARSVSQGGQV